MSYPRFPLDRRPTTDFTFNPKDNLIRNDYEGGYPTARPRYTRILYKASLSYDVTNAETKMLMDFHDVTLTCGSLPFTIEINTIATDGDAEGFSWGTKNVVFSSPPTFTYKGLGVWQAKLEVEEI